MPVQGVKIGTSKDFAVGNQLSVNYLIPLKIPVEIIRYCTILAVKTMTILILERTVYLKTKKK